MTWVPLTSLGTVDFYVRYCAAGGGGSGVGTLSLVPIADLDPTIGTVTVEDGVLVCDFADFAGYSSDGGSPEIVAVPQFEVDAPTLVRLTASNLSLHVGNLSPFVSASFEDGTFDVGTFTSGVNDIDMEPTGDPVTEYAASPAEMTTSVLSGQVGVGALRIIHLTPFT